MKRDTQTITTNTLVLTAEDVSRLLGLLDDIVEGMPPHALDPDTKTNALTFRHLVRLHWKDKP